MFWGLGKHRTRLGRFVDKNGYNQEDLVRVSKVSRNTISKACNDKNYIPSPITMKKILKAVRKIDPNAKADQFWDI